MTNQNSGLDQLSAAELREQVITLAEENERFRSLFITTLPEILTPLTVIHSYGSLLLAENSEYFSPLDEKQTKAVKAMIDNAMMLREIMDKSIRFGRREEPAVNIHSSLIQDYRRQLQEANQQLDKVRLKYQAKDEALQEAANEFVGALSLIVGYSQLFLKQPELIGGPLNSDQLEGITAIDNRAKNLHEAIGYYFFDLLRAIDYVDAEPVPEPVTLAEIGKMTEFVVESELPLETAVSINRYEARSIINLLARGWFKRNKEHVLAVTAASDGILRFRFPHTIEISSYRIDELVDSETGRLKFTEKQRYFDPVGLATGLVEKYGGAVYAELTGESSCHLAFTLPIYQEKP